MNKQIIAGHSTNQQAARLIAKLALEHLNSGSRAEARALWAIAANTFKGAQNEHRI